MYGRTTLSDFVLISEVGRFQTSTLKTVKRTKTLIARRPAPVDSRRCCTRNLLYRQAEKPAQKKRGGRSAAPLAVRGYVRLGNLTLPAANQEDAAGEHRSRGEEGHPHGETRERQV